MTTFARPLKTRIFLLLLGDIKVQIKKRTKVFSAAPVKFSSLWGLYNLVSVIFGNADFWEIKDHSLNMTPFQKYILLWKV